MWLCIPWDVELQRMLTNINGQTKEFMISCIIFKYKHYLDCEIMNGDALKFCYRSLNGVCLSTNVP